MLFARSAAERDKWVLESGGTGPKALSHFHSAPFEREYVLGVKLAQGNFGAVHEVRRMKSLTRLDPSSRRPWVRAPPLISIAQPPGKLQSRRVKSP